MDKSPVFLSYARIDNEKDKHDAHEGWIAYFHSRLRLLLSAKLGAPFDFWRDVQDIEVGQPWHEPIKESLRTAKVIVPVLSPAFLNSDNCVFELEHFLRTHAALRGKHPLAERVIKVLKHSVDPTRLPTTIREPEAYKFFVDHPEKGELTYYTSAFGLAPDRAQAFLDELERLANRLAKLLKDVGEATEPPLMTVFVGVPHPASSLMELYLRVRSELTRRNIKVVPDHKRVFAAGDKVDPILLEQAATNARFGVHLIDANAAKAEMAVDKLQVDATTARVRGVDKLKRMIWVHRSGDKRSQNMLMTSLRRGEKNGGQLLEGDRLIEEPSEQFIGILLRTLFPGEPAIKGSAAPVCYLDFHAKVPATQRAHVVAELRRRGLACRAPLPATFKASDRVAIHWGDQEADWVFSEIDRLRGCNSLVLVIDFPPNAAKTNFVASEVAQVFDLASPAGAMEAT